MTISEWCAMSPNTSKNHFPSAFKKIDFGHLGTHLVIPWPQGTLHDVNVCSSDAKWRQMTPGDTKWRQTPKIVWVMHCECDITIMCKKLIFDRVCTHLMTPKTSWHYLRWHQIPVLKSMKPGARVTLHPTPITSKKRHCPFVHIVCKKMCFGTFLHLPSDTMTAAWRQNEE